jgi:hypothetical protein
MKKLPVVGSTAASTAFCSARIDGPGGLHLFVDGNGKITASNGTLSAPRPNAFSLRNINDCPGATPTCSRVCYVENLKGAQPALYAMYEHNAMTIREILADDALADAWSSVFAEWVRGNASEGFRWSVSGDVYSTDYAMFIANVCRRAPAVRFWIYTRSFGEEFDEIVSVLESVATYRGGNLALNFSCDKDNYLVATEARRYASVLEAGGPRLCYLTTDGTVPADLPADSVIFPDYNIRPRQFATLAESPWWQTLSADQRAMVCPVDAHGKSEKRRCGLAAATCSRCLT